MALEEVVNWMLVNTNTVNYATKHLSFHSQEHVQSIKTV